MKYNTLKSLENLILIGVLALLVKKQNSFCIFLFFPLNYPFFLLINPSTIPVMGKKKKNISIRRNVTRFNYWEDWLLINSKGEEVFRLPITDDKGTVDEDEIERISRKLLLEIINNDKIELIPKLIRLDPYYLQNQQISTRIQTIQKRSKYKEDQRKILEEISTAMLGRKQGKEALEETIRKIKRDIIEFDQMMSGILEGETKEQVTLNREPNLRLVYETYLSVTKYMLRELKFSKKNREHLEFIFVIFGLMVQYIDEPDAVVVFEFKFKDGTTRWSLARGMEIKMEREL